MNGDFGVEEKQNGSLSGGMEVDEVNANETAEDEKDYCIDGDSKKKSHRKNLTEPNSDGNELSIGKKRKKDVEKKHKDTGDKNKKEKDMNKDSDKGKVEDMGSKNKDKSKDKNEKNMHLKEDGKMSRDSLDELKLKSNPASLEKEQREKDIGSKNANKENEKKDKKEKKEDKKDDKNERQKDKDREKEQSKEKSKDKAKNDDRNKTREKSRERSRERKRSVSRDRNDSKHRRASKDRKRSKSREKKRSRSRRRSRSKDRSRDRSKDRRKSKSRDRKRSRSRDRKRSRDRRSKSRDERKRKRSKSSRRSKSRSRSRSSTPKPRVKKPYKFWDKAPVGYENMSVQEYKALQASGQLPATPISIPLSVATSSTNSALGRQARRLYIGNIPFGITEEMMSDFFYEQMKMTGLQSGEGNPVIGCQVNLDKNFAFLEFRTAEDCTHALSFDGMNFQGQALKVRRPRDYTNLTGLPETPIPATNVGSNTIMPIGAVSSAVNDTPYKIFVGGIPSFLADDQVKELLSSFGALKSFHLVKDPATNLSKGYAFCEYNDYTITDAACAGLNGMKLGDKELIVQRATVGSKTTAVNHMPVNLQIPGLDLSEANAAEKKSTLTEVLCLMNMVVPEDLEDDDEYDDIVEDIKEECEKFSRVKSIEIPRPIKGIEVPGVGKIYVEFFTIEDCQKAQSKLAGRKFSNRVVMTSYFDPDKYHRREF